MTQIDSMVLHTEDGDVKLAQENRTPEPNYIRVKSSWDKYGMSRPTYNKAPLYSTGLPDVWRISPRDSKGKTDSVSLDSDKQHYLLKINLEMMTGREYSKAEYFAWFNTKTSQVLQMISWLTSACTKYRSHTNKLGMDNCANFLTGERLGNGLPKFAQLVTGWYTAQPLFENGQILKRTIVSIGESYGFRCIDSREDYWKYSPLREWWLFDMPLITGRIIGQSKAGAYIERDNLHIPYPQFNGSLVFPVWLPVDSVAFISIDDVILEHEGKLPKNWVR